jgi:hypothetical protein
VTPLTGILTSGAGAQTYAESGTFTRVVLPPSEEGPDEQHMRMFKRYVTEGKIAAQSRPLRGAM